MLDAFSTTIHIPNISTGEQLVDALEVQTHTHTRTGVHPNEVQHTHIWILEGKDVGDCAPAQGHTDGCDELYMTSLDSQEHTFMHTHRHKKP